MSSARFHHNFRTPAASLFKDADGVERLYCYSCKKQFTSYDYIVKILEKNPVEFLLKETNKETLDNLIKNKVDRFTLKTQKLEFTTIDQLLDDIYDYNQALTANN